MIHRCFGIGAPDFQGVRPLEILLFFFHPRFYNGVLFFYLFFDLHAIQISMWGMIRNHFCDTETRNRATAFK